MNANTAFIYHAFFFAIDSTKVSRGCQFTLYPHSTRFLARDWAVKLTGMQPLASDCTGNSKALKPRKIAERIPLAAEVRLAHHCSHLQL